MSGTSTSGLPVTSAELTLTDDDAAPEITIAAVQPSVTEASDATADFVVLLSAPSEKTVSVTYSTREETAKALYDFIGQADVLLTFDPGVVEMTIQIALVNDELYEVLPEQFAVQLFLPRNATLVEGNTFAIGTIADDDPEPTLSIADAGVRENEGTITFAVTLSPASGGLVLVDYATEDVTAIGGAESEGADYASVPRGRLVFRPGVTQQTLTVDVFDDELADGTETFTIRLSMAVGAALDVVDDSAQGTIMDDDALTVSVSTSREVTEGNNATFEVEVTGGRSTAAVEVTYEVSGTATSGTDYTAPLGMLTIGVGEPNGTITIDTLVDMVVDGGETLVVTLMDARTDKGDVTAVETPAETEILDEDMVVVSVAAGSPVTEGGNATFTVSLSGAVASPVTVNWSTSDGTAMAGSDYLSDSGTVTFPAESTTPLTIEVMTSRDDLAEADETFTVTVTASGLPAGVSLGTATTTLITIIDDDMVEVSVPSALEVTEGMAATVTVSLSGAVASPVTLDWSTSDGTAAAGSDYTSGSGTVTFPAESIAPQTIEVMTSGDDLAEAAKTFTVTLTQGIGSAGGGESGDGHDHPHHHRRRHAWGDGGTDVGDSDRRRWER